NSISWIGILAPGGTPRDLVEKIAADIRETVARDDVKDKLVQLGAVPLTNSPAQFAAMIDKDRKRYGQIIKERNITVN
ncbi:MAG TPA: tripartite tricarboxylate transporter substrate-binding protein, partial [Ramlibacter sp.]